MKMTSTWARTGIVGAAVLGAACSGNGHEDAGGGSAEVLAVTSAALTQADVASVNLSISGAGIAPAMNTTLAKVGNKFQGTATGIPAGANRTFHGDGVDAAGTIAYAGDASTR